MPPGVRDPGEAVPDLHERTGGERAQVEPRLATGALEQPGDLGVCRVVDLEAAVEPPAVHDVGAHSTPDLVGRLQHDHSPPGAVQVQGAGEPGDPRPHHDDIGIGLGHRTESGPARDQTPSERPMISFMTSVVPP